MKHVYLATVIGYLRGQKSRRLSSLPLAAIILGLATSAMAQTDIRSFGARCDGSDDSGAINAALSSLPNGGTLRLGCTLGIGPTGVIIANKQNITIDGSGGKIIGLATNNAKILFRVEYCQTCAIRNLTISANNAAGLSIYWSSNSTIENNTVTDVKPPAPAGIVGMGNRNNRYLNNRVDTTSGTGVDAVRGLWTGNPATNLVEWNPTIQNNTIRNIAATGLVLHTIGAVVQNNLVENTKGAGIKFEPLQSQGGQTLIDGNTLRNNLFHGIQLSRVDSTVTIRNNNIAANAMGGITSSSGTFPNSQIVGNTFTGNGQAGIYLYDARSLNIQNNLFSGDGNGIIFEAGSSSSLGGVQIASNTIQGATEDGIIVRGRGGSMSGLTVTSNSIMNNKRYGMSVEETRVGSITGVSLSGNCFSGNRVGALLDLRLLNVIAGIFNLGACSPAAQVSAPSLPSTQTPAPTPAPAPAPTPAPAPAPAPTPAPAPAPTPAPSTSPAPYSTFPIRVNTGGATYRATNGDVWLPDFGFNAGQTIATGNAISKTSDPALYQNHRWNQGSFEYSFQAPTGARVVILRFAETAYTAKGQRVFDVLINGQTVMQNYDLIAVAGANVAHDRSFPVQSNGVITIRFVGRVDNPIVSAIEVR